MGRASGRALRGRPARVAASGRSQAEASGAAAGPREGNGRCLQDGVGDGRTEPEGYDFFGDTITGLDLAFCVGIELAADACDFGDQGTETGPHEVVLFNGADSHLGWFSGDLDAGGVDDQRRTAQAFTLPAIPEGPNLAWSVEHILPVSRAGSGGNPQFRVLRDVPKRNVLTGKMIGTGPTVIVGTIA